MRAGHEVPGGEGDGGVISRLRAWLFKPMLDELEARHDAEMLDLRTRCAAAQHECYQLGKACGEVQGFNRAWKQMQDMVDGKLVPELTSEDIERAKKGMVH